MSAFDHFNFFGPIYDFIFGRSEDQAMVRLCEATREHGLLDVGGGTGRVTVLFKDIAKEIFIVDSSLGMLNEAQGKALRTLNAYSEELPIATAAFERVIMVDALHHVQDQEKTLKEIWRVLSPGGRAVIEEPDIHNFWVKLVALAEKVALMRSKFVAPESIIAMCQFEGLESYELIKEKGIVWIILNKIA
jgi:ubiquinone/menaquinone biosynthesis C-methylase UbiE